MRGDRKTLGSLAHGLIAVTVLFLVRPAVRGDNQLGLRVPPGFEVTEFADSRLANDIFCMTLDPKGRVVVSGPGYIRLLVDDDGAGRADRALEFAGGPKDGAQGLFWEGTSLYVTGDGGLRRYRDRNGAGRADGPSELIRALKTGGEHEAHAIRRGPDGWLYLLCGNNTGIDRTFAQLPTSPIQNPIAGCVVRFAPDLKHSEIVADGFRNPYGMDFNLDGELFTFDSDNERCVALPWYEPTRFYHVVPSGHYGWQAPQHAQWWRWPPYFADVVAPLVTLGRGSPTGVVCYRHSQFPEAYRGGMFLLDWTFGRVYFVKMRRAGASYVCEKQVFLEATGDNGFAPTAAAVHPETGDLYISIGGRGTRGAVYRIRYPAGMKQDRERTLLPVKPRSLDWQPGMERDLARQAMGEDGLERLHALHALRRHREHCDSAMVEQAIRANWGHADRSIRQAAAGLIATLSPTERRALGRLALAPGQQATFALGSVDSDPADAFARALPLLTATNASVVTRLAAVRLVQRALGDLTARNLEGVVWAGYSARATVLDEERATRAALVLRPGFPSGDADLDREVTRTLAMIEDDDPALLTRVAERLTGVSHPIEDVHYLIVLARLRATRSSEVTRRVARALLALDRKLTQLHQNRDSNWPLRLTELHAELAHKDPALNATLLGNPEFGRPDHALFARCPGFDRRSAAEIFLARSAKDDNYAWSPALVELLGSLPAERALPVLRRLWDHGGLEDAILPLLGRQPQPVDRTKFQRGLTSPQLATIRLALESLRKLPDSKDGRDLLPLVRAIRRLADGKEENRLRAELVHYLQQQTGQARLGTDKDVWTAWFRRTYPELAKQLGDADGVDVEGWARRLGALDWSTGDVERGRAVFTKASCATCHSGTQALGPDLQGVAGRFSRSDLFTAILQPSKDVSPRYRTTEIGTVDGKIYQGLVIYEVADGLILQTGPAATVRIAASQIAERRLTATSLMPVGLLDRLADQEIVDLYGYLRGLRSENTKK